MCVMGMARGGEQPLHPLSQCLSSELGSVLQSPVSTWAAPIPTLHLARGWDGHGLQELQQHTDRPRPCTKTLGGQEQRRGPRAGGPLLVPSSSRDPRCPRAAGGPAWHLQALWQPAERSHTCCLLRLRASLTAPTEAAGSTAGYRCVPRALPPTGGTGAGPPPAGRWHAPGPCAPAPPPRLRPPCPRQRHHLPVFFF